MKIERGLYLPDVHVPAHDPATLAAVEAYMADHTWNWFGQAGDFLTLDCISRHSEKSMLAQTKETVAGEFAAGNAVLDRWDRILGSDCEKVMLEGNHEYRATAYAEKHPQMRGLLDVPKALRLKDRGWKWVPYWSKGTLYRKGRAAFGHGWYVKDAHAKAHVLAYMENIFTGHTHDVQQYSPTIHGHENTIVGQSCGCLCLYDQDYVQGKPTRWQQAFVEFHWLPDGFFNYYVVRIFKNRFVAPTGVLYDGRAILKGRR